MYHAAKPEADLMVFLNTSVNEVFRVVLFLESIDMFTQELISGAVVNNLLCGLL